VIEEGVTINHAIVCSRAVVKKGAVLPRGCIVSFGVTVGSNVHLPEFTRVTLLEKDPTIELDRGNDSDEEEEEGSGGSGSGGGSGGGSGMKTRPFHLDVLGTDGRGYCWPSLQTDYLSGYGEDDYDDDREDLDVGMDAMRASSLGCVEEEAWRAALWVKSSSVTLTAMPDSPLAGAGGDGSLFSETPFGDKASGEEDRKAALMAHFLFAVSEVVITGYRQGDSAENPLMEIKSLKYAQNTEYSDCIRGVIPALVEVSGAGTEGTSPVAVAKQLKKLIGSEESWGYRILKKLVFDDDDYATVIEMCEIEALKPAHRTTLFPVFRLMLQELHESEILPDRAFLAWAESRTAAGASSPYAELFAHPQVRAFVEWLNESEEEDSDEGDDEDESAEEEDE